MKEKTRRMRLEIVRLLSISCLDRRLLLDKGRWWLRNSRFRVLKTITKLKNRTASRDTLTSKFLLIILKDKKDLK